MAKPPQTRTDGQRPMVIVAWTLVGIPLAWGVYNTLATAAKLFGQ
jgi:hypothetical protein